MMEAKDLNPKIWDEAIKCDAYVQNKYYHKYLDGKAPYEAWSGHKPSISHFRVFGSKAWARIPPEKRKALKPQRKESIMVGYDEYAKGYNIFDPSSQKTFIERSVQFEEEPMQEIKLAQGECSNPPLHDDVSDDTSSYIYDYYIDDDYFDMNSYHDSPIWPKWAEKTIQAVGDLVGDPLDSRTTISQFHDSFSTCELDIYQRCFVMIVSNPHTYQES